MPLTGIALPILLAAVACALLALLVAGRPRLQRAWAAGAMRGLLALGVTVFVLATVAAVLNRQYAFYTSWSDLLGGTESAASQSQYGSHAADALAQPTRSQPAAMTGKLLSVPAGERFVVRQVTGKQSKMNQRVKVFVPKGYSPTKPGGYPVIVALHGFPGNTESFKAVGDFYGSIDRAVANRQMTAPIVVVPNINPSVQFDSECVDSDKGPKTLTWISQDLPAWIRANFNAAHARTSWATWGYSFGGYCAVSAAMHHSDTFGAAIAYQPYFRPEFSASYQPVKPGTPGYENTDLIHLAQTSPQPIAVWLMSSEQDPLSYPSTQSFLAAAHRPMSVTAVITKGGGHRMQVWTRRVPMSFAWLGQTVPGFKAS